MILQHCMATNATIIVVYSDRSLRASEFARTVGIRISFFFFPPRKTRTSLASRCSGSNDRTKPWPLHHFYTRHISCRPNVPTNDALFRTQFGQRQAGTSQNKCARNGPRASGRMSFPLPADRSTYKLNFATNLLRHEQRVQLQKLDDINFASRNVLRPICFILSTN